MQHQSGLRRAHILLLLTSMCFNAAQAQATDRPLADRPRIGLVLSGGGARGAAHIGVLEVLEAQRVPIDVIVGTSMGALVGGAYAAGMPLDEMRERVAELRSADIFRDAPPRSEQSERRKRDDRANLIGPTFGIADGQLTLPTGAVAGVGLEALLRSFAGRQQTPSFDALPIPFRAIATDIETGRMHVLDSGSLAAAMRASISIPGLLAPAEIDGRLLVDGGLTRNLPLDVARALGVDLVIAVNLGTPLLQRDQVTSLVGVTTQMINILTEQNVRQSLASVGPRDVLISPALGDFSAADFDRMSDAVPIGATAARARLDRLQSLALSPAAYQAHRAAQRGDRSVQTARIDEIRFEGIERSNPEVLRTLLRTRPGQPLDSAVLDADLARLHGRGGFDRIGYRLLDEGGRQVLVIDADESAGGAQSLRFGLSLASDLAGNAHFQALARHRRTWINAYGAEWHSDLLVGRVNRLTSTFHQPLNLAQQWFVAPYLDAEQRPYDLFQDDNRIARFLRQTGLVGIDAGLQAGRLGELRLGLFRGRRSFKLDTGPAALGAADAAIDLGGLRMSLRSDRLDSGTLPRNGHAVEFKLLASEPGLGARDRYNRWQAQWNGAFSHGEHTLNLGLEAGGTFGSGALPVYDLFPLGGFLRLSGLQPNQLLGRSLAFGRAVYGRQLADVPLLSGVFGGFSVEAGRVGDPLLPGASAATIAAASLFIATQTPLGPIYVGLGQARGGQRALYLHLGIP